jgi:hypothetical protein
LAWVVKAEKQLNFPLWQINLFNETIQEYFSEGFKCYLDGGENSSGNSFPYVLLWGVLLWTRHCTFYEAIT